MAALPYNPISFEGLLTLLVPKMEYIENQVHFLQLQVTTASGVE